MKKLIAIFAVFFASVAGAHAQSLAVGPSVSSLGVGGGMPLKLTNSLVINLSGNFMEYGTSKSVGDIKYKVALDFVSIGATIDYHPLQNGLLFSAGYYWNNDFVRLNATPAGNTRIGNQTYTPSEVGQVKGALTIGSITPFVGVGYDTTFHSNGRLAFSIRAGAFMIGGADVSMSTTGSLAKDPAFQAELRREEKSIEDELNGYGFVPVISIGVKYRF